MRGVVKKRRVPGTILPCFAQKPNPEGIDISAGAGRLLGAVVRLNDQWALRLVPVEQAWHDSSMAIVRVGLGEEGLARAWAEGQAMTLEQAAEYALEGHI